MNDSLRLRIVVAVAVLVTVIALAVTGAAYQRASQLQALRLETNRALQEVFRLSNDTFRLLYSADELEPAFHRWQGQFESALTSLDDLAFHPGLQRLDESAQQQVRQTRSLLTVTTNGFAGGGDQLDRLLGSAALDTVDASNLADTIAALQETTADGDESRLVFGIQQAFFQIEATNDGIEFFITSALDALAEDLAAATDRAIRVTVLTGFGLALVLLAAVLGAMIVTLRVLARSNRELERRVAERTRSIQQLLDASGEGFFSFGTDLTINPEVSRECEVIFGRPIAGLNVAEVLFREAQQRQDFADAMQLVFSGTADADVVFDVVDTTLQVNSRTVEVGFRVIDRETVLCVLRDVTSQRELEARVADQQAKREMLLRVVTARSHFLSLVQDAEAVFTRLESHSAHGEFRAGDEEFPPLLRSVHTYKSNAAFLKMERTAAAAHDLETALEDAHVMGDLDGVAPAIMALREAWEDEARFVRDSLGEEWVRGRTVHEVDGHTLQTVFRHAMEHHGDDRVLIEGLDEIARVPLASLFARVADLVQILAATRGKEVEVTIADGGVRVHEPIYHALSDGLNHMIRNMVDHGIELPRRRERAGKPSAGQVELKAEYRDGTIRVSVSDDGAGIDVERIVARARERGVAVDTGSLTPQDVVRLVFTDGISTAIATTATSGRGVGLPAVRRRIRELGGTISLSTKRGRGTTFTLTLPDRSL